MKRCDSALPFLLLTLGVASGGLAGCEEEFSDEKFGVLDLASYYDGGTQANPSAGIPEQIEADPGFLGGQAAEYYDFGLVPSIVEPTTGVPTAVRVQPMYFFFDGPLPLFSSPVRELRNGVDWIRGGHDVLNPNPKDFCQGASDQTDCQKMNETERRKSYPLRRRDPLIDPNRNSDDYQRPLVDLSPRDRGGPATEYTGLWEIIEVSVPKGYDPDSIKHVATLQKAVASGKFKLRSTGKVINCPLVDERTYVNRGMTGRRVFRPRIELWYRRLQAYCFLANGWETLGNEAGVRYFAGVESDVDRLDTFDVKRLQLGEGPDATQRVLVPVGRAYEPAVIVDDQSFINPPIVTRVAYNVITSAQPRHSAGDPPGYTPMRWMFDIPAAEDYTAGTWKSENDLDLNAAIARRAGTVSPTVKNLATRGVALPCSYKRQPGTELCGKSEMIVNGVTVVDATGDPVCNSERDPFNPNDLPLECNPETCFCDAPFVGYGQACGPGVAQCSPKADKFSPDGYSCFPPWGGFCQKACGGANSLTAQNRGKEPNQWVDSRCGGATGYICLATPFPTCIKLCDQNVTDAMQCSVNTQVGEQTRDIQEGQTCQDFGLHVCSWPDTWEPKEFPIPE
jgi:hypothetical protein